MSIFEKTRGQVWLRRVRKNRTLGRARPRLLELLENNLVCSKEDDENKTRTLGLDRVDAIVKGIPVVLCDESEREKIIGGKKNVAKFFTVLVSNELTKSIVLEATTETEGVALRKGICKILDRYRDLCFAHRKIKNCTPKLSSSETSQDRILEIWATFFENCAKMTRFDTRCEFTLLDDEKEDVVLTLDQMKESEEEVKEQNTGFYWKDEVWEECHDENTGLLYYYNRITKESVWDLKDEEEGGSWEECLDEDSGLIYYYNHTSGESVWKSEEEEYHAEEIDLTSYDHNQTTFDDSVWKSKKEEEEFGYWEECHDEETDLTYYYNTVSGESVWEIEHHHRHDMEDEDKEWIENNDNRQNYEDDEWIDYDGYYAHAVEDQYGDEEFLHLNVNDWISVDGCYFKSKLGFGTCQRSGKSGWFPMRIISFDEEEQA